MEGGSEGGERSEIESKSRLSGILCVSVCVCMQVCVCARLCVHAQPQRGKESFAYRTGSGSLTIAL